MHTIEQLRSGELAGIKRLALSCGLTHFPPEILSLADTLEILDLSGNALSELPAELTQLGKLRVIFCSDNQFTTLPEVLGRCPELSMVGFKANRIRRVSAESLPAKLRWLILTDNEIEELPAELGQRTQLQKLMLAGNRLQTLPASLANCQRLELIRIAANQLQELPAWLLDLPRLSWLAYAGNPFADALAADALEHSNLADIAWEHLALEHRLGEGASGVIHHARYQSAEQASEQASEQGAPAVAQPVTQPVAVKLFKGATTSDGSPLCEMAAAIAAGAHPNLIRVLGRVADHPAKSSGLVLELISPDFGNLAGPPSLDSCTRDIYAPDTRFELPVLLQLAQSMASAAGHLHSLGIMHGDFYAHNILHCGQGRALLGDFGAASFYARDDQAVADSLQRLEVRAFGCLLEELIAHCPVSAGPDSAGSDSAGSDSAGVAAMLATLNQLAGACLSETPTQRPLFSEINEQLLAIIHEQNDHHQ